MKQHVLTCTYCGTSFTSKRSDALYCCNSHRQLAYLNRPPEVTHEVYYPSPKTNESITTEIKSPPADTSSAVRVHESNQRKQLNEELKAFRDKMKEDQEKWDEGLALDYVRRTLERIINNLHVCNEQEKISTSRIKWLLSDTTSLLESEQFKNIEHKLGYSKFIREIFLTHLQYTYDSIRKMRERFMDYEIPQDIIAELDEISNGSR